MADNGIDVLVNLSGGSLRRGAKESLELQQVESRIVHFFNPDWRLRGHPEFGDLMAKSLEFAVQKLDFKGLKISKALGLYLTDAAGERLPVDTPILDPLWAMAGKLGVPVAIHTGDPKAFWEPLTPENERYAELVIHPRWSFASPEHPSRETLLAERDRLLERHRETTFICVHFGNNPEDLDYVEQLLMRHPNVVLDTSARLGEIGRHPSDRVRALFIKHADRILFGTDFGLGPGHIMLGSSGEEEPTMADVKPFFDAHWRFFEGSEKQIDHPTPIQGDWKIDAINLPDEVLHKLYRGNAERLLRLGAALDHRPDAGVGQQLQQQGVGHSPVGDSDPADPAVER
jgi:predicted TIM-barrel fold metal-dependent hydrolase